jgi:hypothetical protein
MRCSKIQNLLSAYLDGELTSDQTDSVEAHLHLCSQCQDALEELRLMVSASRNLASVSPKTDLWPNIQRRVVSPPERATARKPRPAILSGWRPRIAWALVLASIFLAVFVFRDHIRPPGPEVPTGPSQGQLSVDPRDDIALTRQHYERSAAALEQIVAHRSHDLDLDRALLYREKLHQLDGVIAECSLALEKNKYDVRAQQVLFNAYDQKISTLREMAVVAAH